MRITFITLLLISFLLFLSCTACSLPFGEESAPDELSIVSWNVQNLFDDVSDGTEYDEFNPDKSNWNTQLFYLRLHRVEEVLESLFENLPHIILMQEIENAHTLEILNSEILKNAYGWQIFVQEEGQSVGTAILSSIPVKSVTSLETGYWGKLKLRPITEVHLDLNGTEFVIFNNHWKSKSGGAAATEEGRIQSAETLTERIKKLTLDDEEILIIAAGDFNENHDEYKVINRSYRTALISIIEDVPHDWSASLYTTSKKDRCGVENNRLVLYSPWYNANSSGSYAYKSRWSKIDHFFLWESLFDGTGYEYDSFQVIKDSKLLNDYNYPNRWNSLTEEGFSDHLPIQLKLINNGY